MNSSSVIVAGAIETPRLATPVMPARESDVRKNLFEEIRSAIVFGDSDTRILSPGGLAQDWLIDMRQVLLSQGGADAAAELFWGEFRRYMPFQVGGLEAGAIPLVIAILMKGRQLGLTVNGFFVRKERKPSGLGKSVEGRLNEHPVVLVDDLLNSGNSMEKARSVVADAGHRVLRCFTIVDFNAPDGRQWLAENAIRHHSIFKIGEFGLKLPKVQAANSPAPMSLVWNHTSPDANQFHPYPKSMPVLVDDMVCFGTDRGIFWALDQKTGVPRWNFKTTDTTGKGIWSTAGHDQGRLYFGGYDGNVYCLEARSGREIWRKGYADWVGSSPALCPQSGLLYVGLEHERPNRKGSLAALEMETGEKVWEHWVTNYLHGSPIYCRDLSLVVVGTNDNSLIGCDALTGKLAWSLPVGGPIKHAAAYHAGLGTIIAGSMDGRIYAVAAASGQKIWDVKTGDAIFTVPLIVEDLAFVGSGDKHLYILDLRQRQVVRKLWVGARVHAPPSLIEGRIVVGANNGNVVEIDLATKQITRKIQLPDGVSNAVAYSEEHRLFFALTATNKLFAFRK